MKKSTKINNLNLQNCIDSYKKLNPRKPNSRDYIGECEDTSWNFINFCREKNFKEPLHVVGYWDTSGTKRLGTGHMFVLYPGEGKIIDWTADQKGIKEDYPFIQKVEDYEEINKRTSLPHLLRGEELKNFQEV